MPTQEANVRPLDASAAHDPIPAAAVDDTGVPGVLSWDQDRGLESSSENDGEIQRVFIDNPFRARRPVLRELPFAEPVTAGWDEAATDTAAAWANQASHQPSESTGARRHPVPSGSFPEDSDSGRFGVEEAPQRFGLDTQGLLGGIYPGRNQTLWPAVPCLGDDEGDMDGISPRWRGRHGARNPDRLDEEIGRRKPVWGESGDEGKEADARHGGGQTNPRYPHQNELASWGSGGATTNNDQVCQVG